MPCICYSLENIKVYVFATVHLSLENIKLMYLSLENIKLMYLSLEN